MMRCRFAFVYMYVCMYVYMYVYPSQSIRDTSIAYLPLTLDSVNSN